MGPPGSLRGTFRASELCCCSEAARTGGRVRQRGQRRFGADDGDPVEDLVGAQRGLGTVQHTFLADELAETSEATGEHRHRRAGPGPVACWGVESGQLVAEQTPEHRGHERTGLCLGPRIFVGPLERLATLLPPPVLLVAEGTEGRVDLVAEGSPRHGPGFGHAAPPVPITRYGTGYFGSRDLREQRWPGVCGLVGSGPFP